MTRHQTTTKAVTAYSMIVEFVSLNHQMWAIQDDAQYGTGWTPEREREFGKLQRASSKMRDKAYEASVAIGLDWEKEVEAVSDKLWKVARIARSYDGATV